MKIFLILFILSSTVTAETLSICLETKSAPISEIDGILFPKIYQGLVRYDSTKKKYFPVLIEEISMTSSKIVHIKIKKDISFHSNKYFTPTRSLTTDDIIFSLNNAPKEKNYFIKNIESINKVNDRILTIIGKDSFQNVYAGLSEASASIRSQEYYQFSKKMPDKNLYTLYPIGTGPYKFSGATKDSVNFVPFKNYRSKTALVKKISYQFLESKERKSCNINKVIAAE